MQRGAAITRLMQRWPATAAVAAAAVYAATMATALPYRRVFEFDTDEGINAGKARLLDHGYALYGQLWNDQPPLFTHLLRRWFDVFGWEVASGRLLVLLFAAGLVFAVYDLTRLESSHRAALLATAALAASAYLPRLSLSLMIGLPAVALATLAVWALFRWRHDARDAWLVASGVLFGASLATKLFTAFLLPVLALWLIALAHGSARWRPAALWVAVALLAAAGLLLALGGLDALPQLLSPHAAGRVAPMLQRFDAEGLLVTARAEWPLTLLAGPAFAWLIWQRRSALLLFPAWALTAFVALLGHAPVWYHHQLLLTVPYCPAIGVCLAELMWRPAPRAMRRAATALAGAVVALAALRLALIPERPADDARDAIVAALRAQLGARRVALGADPIYAFRAGAVAPPQLAVLSTKRAATDPDLPATIAAVFAADAPVAVALGPAPGGIDAALRRAMADRYTAVFTSAEGNGVTVFARRDRAAASAPTPAAP
ncbi:MAG: glycosyltransferase family 39 protein [bacterium]